LIRSSTYYMYAFTPDQQLCLLYEDFYLTIGDTFYELLKFEERQKKSAHRNTHHA